MAVGRKVEGGGACCVCMCTARRTPSVHVDQWLNCSKAVLDDGSSLLLSCAEAAAPCSAHQSGYPPTTHTPFLFRWAALERSQLGTVSRRFLSDTY